MPAPRPHAAFACGAMLTLFLLSVGGVATVHALARVEEVGVYRYHSCVRLDTGQIKCWGVGGYVGYGSSTDYGNTPESMGDGLPFVDLDGTVKALGVGSMARHTCVIMDNDQIKCWGTNDNGQLGMGDDMFRGNDAGQMGSDLDYVDVGPSLSVKAVVMGNGHTCAMTTDGDVKCWGSSQEGILGLADGVEQIWGDGPNEMGIHLPFVNLGSTVTATALAAGSSHTCALLDDGGVKCWGQGDYAQLGTNTMDKGLDVGSMGNNLKYVDLGLSVKAVSAGDRHTCAILSNDLIKCWGRNNYYQLALGDSYDRGDSEYDDMGSKLPFVGLGTDRTALSISVGGDTSCVVLDNYQLRCFGPDFNNKIGLNQTLGEDYYLGDDLSELGDGMPNVDLGTGINAMNVSVGTTHTCVRVWNAGDKIRCFGLNQMEGRLGMGIVNELPNDSDMGDALPWTVILSTLAPTRSPVIPTSAPIATLAPTTKAPTSKTPTTKTPTTPKPTTVTAAPTPALVLYVAHAYGDPHFVGGTAGEPRSWTLDCHKLGWNLFATVHGLNISIHHTGIPPDNSAAIVDGLNITDAVSGEEILSIGDDIAKWQSSYPSKAGLTFRVIEPFSTNRILYVSKSGVYFSLVHNCATWKNNASVCTTSVMGPAFAGGIALGVCPENAAGSRRRTDAVPVHPACEAAGLKEPFLSSCSFDVHVTNDSTFFVADAVRANGQFNETVIKAVAEQAALDKSGASVGMQVSMWATAMAVAVVVGMVAGW